MPVLLSESLIEFQFSDLARRSPISRPALPAPRSAGVHLSGVLAAVAVEIGVLKPGEKFEEEMPLRFAVGHMWEEFCVSFYPEVLWQPGEIEQDGVWMTPDGLQSEMVQGPDGERLDGLHEFKATWKKTRSGPDLLREWYWMNQGKGYCKGFGVRHVKWHVLYANGDYARAGTGSGPGPGPQYKTYLVEFSEKEIEQTWQMVMNHRHLAKAE